MYPLCWSIFEIFFYLLNLVFVGRNASSFCKDKSVSRDSPRNLVLKKRVPLMANTLTTQNALKSISILFNHDVIWGDEGLYGQTIFEYGLSPVVPANVDRDMDLPIQIAVLGYVVAKSSTSYYQKLTVGPTPHAKTKSGHRVQSLHTSAEPSPFNPISTFRSKPPASFTRLAIRALRTTKFEISYFYFAIPALEIPLDTDSRRYFVGLDVESIKRQKPEIETYEDPTGADTENGYDKSCLRSCDYTKNAEIDESDHSDTSCIQLSEIMGISIEPSSMNAVSIFMAISWTCLVARALKAFEAPDDLFSGRLGIVAPVQALLEYASNQRVYVFVTGRFSERAAGFDLLQGPSLSSLAHSCLSSSFGSFIQDSVTDLPCDNGITPTELVVSAGNEVQTLVIDGPWAPYPFDFARPPSGATGVSEDDQDESSTSHPRPPTANGHFEDGLQRVSEQLAAQANTTAAGNGPGCMGCRGIHCKEHQPHTMVPDTAIWQTAYSASRLCRPLLKDSTFWVPWLRQPLPSARLELVAEEELELVMEEDLVWAVSGLEIEPFVEELTSSFSALQIGPSSLKSEPEGQRVSEIPAERLKRQHEENRTESSDDAISATPQTTAPVPSVDESSSLPPKSLPTAIDAPTTQRRKPRTREELKATLCANPAKLLLKKPASTSKSGTTRQPSSKPPVQRVIRLEVGKSSPLASGSQTQERAPALPAVENTDAGAPNTASSAPTQETVLETLLGLTRPAATNPTSGKEFSPTPRISALIPAVEKSSNVLTSTQSTATNVPTAKPGKQATLEEQLISLESKGVIRLLRDSPTVSSKNVETQKPSRKSRARRVLGSGHANSGPSASVVRKEKPASPSPAVEDDPNTEFPCTNSSTPVQESILELSREYTESSAATARIPLGTNVEKDEAARPFQGVLSHPNEQRIELSAPVAISGATSPASTFRTAEHATNAPTSPPASSVQGGGSTVSRSGPCIEARRYTQSYYCCAPAGYRTWRCPDVQPLQGLPVEMDYINPDDEQDLMEYEMNAIMDDDVEMCDLGYDSGYASNDDPLVASPVDDTMDTDEELGDALNEPVEQSSMASNVFQSIWASQRALDLHAIRIRDERLMIQANIWMKQIRARALEDRVRAMNGNLIMEAMFRQDLWGQPHNADRGRSQTPPVSTGFAPSTQADNQLDGYRRPPPPPASDTGDSESDTDGSDAAEEESRRRQRQSAPEPSGSESESDGAETGSVSAPAPASAAAPSQDDDQNEDEDEGYEADDD
ncbi:MAG: hypothetical protein Q9166_006503 [cf. Caloplaca sp. 2 TL-2023]